ncbi:hypothetical protein N665_0383s0175 [Sinapis alba]|nr:hypothetical protein N665_0383s0175 [Sinapis alba]
MEVHLPPYGQHTAGLYDKKIETLNKLRATAFGGDERIRLKNKRFELTDIRYPDIRKTRIRIWISKSRIRWIRIQIRIPQISRISGSVPALGREMP